MPGNDEKEKEREKITSFPPASGKGRPGPRSKATRWKPSVGTILCCALLLVLAPIMAINSLWHEGPDHAGRWNPPSTRSKGFRLPPVHREIDTLVLYVFSNTDAEYESNMQFFLRHAVREDDGCEYVIVIQTGGTSKPLAALPAAPSNVRFLHHPNECYDWGTMGWVLSERLVDVNHYQYFILMNSSVRGPFIPPYMQGKIRWQDVLISRISDSVKLVGPTISCEGSPKAGNVSDQWRENPHVQSYVLATDRVGLSTMWEDGTVFACYTSMWDVIYYSELGSSWSVLAAGYNLDSLMMRYQGVDWTVLENWECNANTNPYGEMYYDGITIDPFEVMFVKVKEVLLERGWMYATHARQYDSWLTQQIGRLGKQDIVSNVWKSPEARRLKSKSIGFMRHLGQACFDTEFYRANNWDQVHVMDPYLLWEHWVQAGQFETRPHRFLCDVNVD